MKISQHNPWPAVDIAQKLALMVIAAIIFSIIITLITIFMNKHPLPVRTFAAANNAFPQRDLNLKSLHCGIFDSVFLGS